LKSLSPKTIPAYLRGHAELPPDRWARPDPSDHVIVIPMRGEGETIAPLLRSLHDTELDGDVLLIAVVNGSEDGTDAHHAENERTLTLLRDSFSVPESACGLGRSGKVQILLVDKASPQRRLPKKQGVGLARKIGCDLALLLQYEGHIASPWIHSSDADVRLPSDYFRALDRLSAQANPAALTYPFVHEPEGAPEQRLAICLYEISLYYYALALRWAGSPWAYQTIGSTLAVRGWNYAAVRGFPRREAGEDFYLLNKVAKTGRIFTPESGPIIIRGRKSDRVPFGTGAAMNQMTGAYHELAQYPLYDPSLFRALLGTLQGIRSFAETRSHEAFRTTLMTQEGFPLRETLTVLTEMGVEAALTEAARQAPTEKALTYRLHTWFDSFRTLRFIHQLRDAALPSPPWHEALNRACFVVSKPQQEHLLDQDLDLLRNRIAEESSFPEMAGLSPHDG
jgi:hypothetical protein